MSGEELKSLLPLLIAVTAGIMGVVKLLKLKIASVALAWRWPLTVGAGLLTVGVVAACLGLDDSEIVGYLIIGLFGGIMVGEVTADSVGMLMSLTKERAKKRGQAN